MRRSFNTTFLVNALPIIVVLIVFAVIFDWGNAVKVFFREIKVEAQKKYVDDIIYDVKIDKIESTSKNGKIEDEYILINTKGGNVFYIKYEYDESKKKTNLDEYKNYTIKRYILNLNEGDKLKEIINGNTSYSKTNTNIQKTTGDYQIYVNNKVKRIISKNDIEAMNLIQKIEQESKAVVNV